MPSWMLVSWSHMIWSRKPCYITHLSKTTSTVTLWRLLVLVSAPLLLHLQWMWWRPGSWTPLLVSTLELLTVLLGCTNMKEPLHFIKGNYCMCVCDGWQTNWSTFYVYSLWFDMLNSIDCNLKKIIDYLLFVHISSV